MAIISQPLTDPDALSKLCVEIEGSPYIAVDTEFTRVRTYLPQLELVQIATEDVAFCIDVPCIHDWSHLRKLFNAESTTFVLHAADQDLEIFDQHQLVPSRMIDTQIAAQLCGEEKLSYMHQVEKHLGVKLSKDETRSNWNKRPLSREQITYALDDVLYILPLFQHFRTHLQRVGRLSWLEEESTRLFDLSKLNDEIESVWKPFRSGARLSTPDQYVAKELLIWREKRAQKLDWPRQWVLSDRQIVDLVKLKPASLQQTADLIGLKRGKIPHWVSRVHTTLKHKPENTHSPLWHSWASLSSGDKKRANAILEHINKIASENEIPGPLLCTKQEVAQLVRGDHSARMFSGWRKKFVNATTIKSMLS